MTQRGNWWYFRLTACIMFMAAGLFEANAQIYKERLTLKAGDTLFLSRQFLVPFSDSLLDDGGNLVSRDRYQLNYSRGSLLFPESPPGDSVVLYYRIFPDSLPSTIAIRSYQQAIDSAQPLVNRVPSSAEDQQQKIFWDETGGIRKSGSLSTGVNVGNNRSASLTSGLRLQLQGDLGDGLQIQGALTDENIPVQPDGTTQQLSDFDRVFIRLNKGPYAMTIGDYEVSRTQSRFANYYRNVQGLQGSYETAKTRLKVSGAVAKGRFHTNRFNGIDGVSGPYRLSGKNGEQFFIVLAGSERVYLNGQVMQRGEANDYVINYNTAEITFTAQHVITNVTRIVVDFEYTDQNFNRSLLVAEWDQKAWNDRLHLNLSYARDADNPNAPFDDPELYNLVRDTLATLGDASQPILTSGVFAVGYAEEEPRYEQRDTVISGTAYTYYVRSTDPERAIYQILFSQVGAGNGHYERVLSDNATVYRWVAPGPDGTPLGNYAPVRQWVLPQLLQVVNLQSTLQLTKTLELYHETALSQQDLNRLSSLGDGDNLGLATMLGIRGKRIKLSDSTWLSLDVSQRYVQQRYQNLDRVYRAEYNRIWNLDPSEERLDEWVSQGKVAVDWRHEIELTAEGGIRQTGPGQLDSRQVYGLWSNLPRFLQGELTYTRIQNQRSASQRDRTWNRYEGNVFAPLNGWQPGIEIWAEDQQRRQDSRIQDSSFAFIDLKPYIRTVNMKRFSLDASFNYRLDREWQDDRWRDKSIAYTTYLKASGEPIKNWRIQSTSAYRILNVQDSLFEARGLENSRVLTTNFQTNYASPNRLILTNWLYEVSSEQLAEQELRYIQVPAGQGTYIWIDSLGNNDGFQDLDEFQLATNPLVADYIRILVPTRNLVPSTRLGLSGSLRLSLRGVIEEGAQWWRTALREIQSVSNLRINQSKNRNSDIGSYFINVADPFADSSLLSATYNLRQDLFIFQSSRTGSLSLTYQDNQVQLFLNTGVERRGQRSAGVIGRLNLGGDLERSQTLELTYRQGSRFQNAGEGSLRNYQITFLEAQPELNLQLGAKLRLSGAYAYNRRQSIHDQNPALTQAHKLIMQSRWNIKDFNNLNARLDLVYMLEEGETNSATQFELRQGLQPGGNAILQVLTTFRILQNVELSLTYDGRISGATPPVHTGRVQVRAFF